MMTPPIVSIFDRLDEFEDFYSVTDVRFDLIYPREIRELSSRHWTPVAVALHAAKLLVNEPETRVLDLGCGPGKFCIVGALTTAGHFTGVEQRERLADLARTTIQRHDIRNAEIIHRNLTQIDFSAFDAFYLFNPFEENLFTTGKIDTSVELSKALYEKYTRHVSSELARAPLGTRVVTYCGFGEEIPGCYDCEGSSFSDNLKLWRKTRHSPTAELPSIVPILREIRRSLIPFATDLPDWGLAR